jgi:hypothetical protein
MEHRRERIKVAALRSPRPPQGEQMVSFRFVFVPLAVISAPLVRFDNTKMKKKEARIIKKNPSITKEEEEPAQ